MPAAFEFVDNSERLFGREDDIEYLQWRARRTGFTALTGPPRMGKTWLLREFCRRSCEDPKLLVGYAESHGEGDLLRAAVADLYFRWFADSSFGEQAKALWRTKKESIFSRFAAKTVEVASELVEAVPLIGEGTKPVLKGAKTAFAMLAEADEKLRGVTLQQDLTYDQALAAVTMLAEVAQRSVLMVLDGFDLVPDPGRQIGVIEGFLSNHERWPHTHIFAAIRHNATGEPAGEVGGLCKLHPIADVQVLEGMTLEAAEVDRLVSYLRNKVEVARGTPGSDLLELVDGYPAVVGRWADLDADIRSRGDLEEQARNAKEGLYPELERFRKLSPPQQRLGMRLAILPQFGDVDDWEVFKPIIFEGLSGADIAPLQERHLLEAAAYPTYGHATRHAAALGWFSRQLPAPLAQETDCMVRTVAGRFRGTDGASLRFAGTLQAMALQLSSLPLSSNAVTVLESALCLITEGAAYRGRQDLVAAKARHVAGAWPGYGPLAGVALFNAMCGAREEEDLARCDSLLEELRALGQAHPEDAAVRGPLAAGLYNAALYLASKRKDLARCDSLLEELRELGQAHPEDAAVRGPLAAGLYNAMCLAKEEESLERRDSLLEELRALGQAYPEDAAIREPLAKALFNAIIYAKEEESLERRDSLLEELRALGQAQPEDAGVRELLTKALTSPSIETNRAHDSEQRGSPLRQLPEPSAEHSDRDRVPLDDALIQILQDISTRHSGFAQAFVLRELLGDRADYTPDMANQVRRSASATAMGILRIPKSERSAEHQRNLAVLVALLRPFTEGIQDNNHGQEHYEDYWAVGLYLMQTGDQEGGRGFLRRAKEIIEGDPKFTAGLPDSGKEILRQIEADMDG
jgi:hypothetical protein